MKQPQKALANSLAALSLAKAAGDPEMEGGIETALMIGFRKAASPRGSDLFRTGGGELLPADSQEHLRAG